MWRYAFRRAFFLLVGFVFLTVPLFAGLRYAEHVGSCYELVSARCGSSDAGVGQLLREGFGFMVSLAAMLLALFVAVDLLSMLRTRLRRRAE